MAEPIINELDIASWLRKARRAPDPIAFLDRLNDDATEAVGQNDQFVTVAIYKDSSQTLKRDVDARFLQHVTEICLQRLEAEADAGGAGKLPPVGSIRYLSFS